MGITPYPLIHVRDPSKFHSDSSLIYNQPLYRSFFSNDGKSLLIQVIHTHIEDPEVSNALADKMYTLTQNLGFDHYRIIGKLVAQKEFISLIREDFSLFLFAALAISFILLVIILKSFRTALLPYLISLTTLLWLLGLMAALSVPITILGSLIPPVILFVSSSDAIHLINAFRNSSEEKYIIRLQMAVKKVWTPTLLTSITTSIGFFSLLSINTQPIQNLGIFVGIGVFMAFVITFSFGPLLLRKSYPAQAQGHFQKNLALWVLKNSRLVIGTSIVVVVISIYGVLQIKVDAYLLDDLPENSEVKTDFEFTDSHFNGSKPWEMAYWAKDSSKSMWDPSVMHEAQKIHEYLENEYPIGRLWSPVSLIKYGHQMTNGGLPEQYAFPDQKEFGKSYRAIRHLKKRNELPKLIAENGFYGRFVGYIPEYGSHETIQRNKKLLQFLNDNIDRSVIDYRLTGTTYLIDKSHDLLSFNLLKGLMIAIGVISLILGVYFRSFKILIISLIPNIIPLLITAGFMGLTGISLKLTTSIIFAISFGIAVDDTIHFISVYRRQKGANPIMNLIRTYRSAGKAIIITSVVIIAGFTLFIFSSFGATHYLGVFLTLSLTSALVIDLSLLSLLLHFSQTRIDNRS